MSSIRRLDKRRLLGIPALVVAITLFIAACGDDATPTPSPTPDPQAELAGGVVATFDVLGSTFRAFVTNSTAIEDLFRLHRGESTANIPNGILRPGPGAARHNAPWSWHLDPEDVQMAEVTIEVCSGRPAFVEEDLDHWLNGVGRYCPWSAKLVALEDHR